MPQTDQETYLLYGQIVATTLKWSTLATTWMLAKTNHSQKSRVCLDTYPSPDPFHGWDALYTDPPLQNHTAHMPDRTPVPHNTLGQTEDLKHMPDKGHSPPQKTVKIRIKFRFQKRSKFRTTLQICARTLIRTHRDHGRRCSGRVSLLHPGIGTTNSATDSHLSRTTGGMPSSLHALQFPSPRARAMKPGCSPRVWWLELCSPAYLLTRGYPRRV